MKIKVIGDHDGGEDGKIFQCFPQWFIPTVTIPLHTDRAPYSDNII